MKIEGSKVINKLKEQNVGSLYHANTVLTSISFLQNGTLLSRKKMNSLSLPQTSQKSDLTDEKFGVYNDIFLDSIDIHEDSPPNLVSSDWMERGSPSLPYYFTK